MTPIFIDLETRSACELRDSGAYNYAKHPTTRLLTVAWKDGDNEHVWLPGLRDNPPEPYESLHLPGVRVHVGGLVPAPLCRVAHRLWIGHNSFTFDRLVWLECTEGFEHVQWDDTYPRALAAGLPGGLEKIGQFLWGEGKYESGSKAMKAASKATGLSDCEPDNVPIGQLMLIARYNVQDVRLTAALWDRLQHEAVLDEHEQRVLRAHDAINTRGCRIDRGLVTALVKLAEESKDHAIEQIADLTLGVLGDKAAVQSRARVLSWLDSQGAKGFRQSGLRKEIVTRYIDEHSDEETEESADSDEPLNLARIVKVLELRMQALRITGGKLDAALWAMDDEHRARGLFTFHGAHTGRWAGRRIQVQNLPRPKDGVDPWTLIRLYERHEGLTYDNIKFMLPVGARGHDGKLLYPYLSVDDAASALIRNIFLPDRGDILAAADYAAIECRVLAWCAGEKWLLESFWNGDDPYLAMAERIVGPRASWPVCPDPKTGKPLPIKKHPYRQIVGKIPELAAGYQVGGPKLALYAAGMGFNLTAYGVTGTQAVIAYRKAHPAIAGEEAGEYNGVPYFRGGLWCQLNAAVLAAVAGNRTYAGRCCFHMERGNLICMLPSERRLTYRSAQIDMVQPSWAKGTDKRVEAVTYFSPRYGRKSLYGGSICENVVQAISRDILAAGMVRLEAAGIPVVLHVHDELVSSTKPERFDDFMRLVTECPPWLTDFPLDAEGSLSPRYAKSPPPPVKDETWRNGSFLKV